MDMPIMSSQNSEADAVMEFPPFTQAERIKQLNDIDKSINQLLHSAGLALQTLSSSQDANDGQSEERRKAFERASDSYLRTLQTVDVGLRRQIYGLEEADIIPAEKAKKPTKDPQEIFRGSKGPAPVQETSTITDGGMGKLDIGFLNTRSGRVGRDMEAELWEKSRTFLEGIPKDGRGAGESEKGDTQMTE